jgi:hypothetical protein
MVRITGSGVVGAGIGIVVGDRIRVMGLGVRG